MKKLISVLTMFFVWTLCTAAQATEITIVGTGSGSAILQAVGDAFSQSNPGVTIQVPKSIGSGGGIKAVGTDEAVIGRIAREIKENEKPLDLTYIPFAKTPIVFMTHKSVGVPGLSAQQICDIYSEKITNWKEVGGKDAKIRVVRREEGDSSLEVLLQSLPGFKDITITSKSKTTFSDPETVALVETKEDTIAFGTYANARVGKVEILKIDGKGATDAGYPAVGILALIFKEKNKTGHVKQFVEFATSAAAHEAVKGAGGLPF